MGLDRGPDKALFIETAVLIREFTGAAVLRQQPEVDDLSGCGVNGLRLETWVVQERPQRIRTRRHRAINREQRVEPRSELLLHQAQIIPGHAALDRLRI